MDRETNTRIKDYINTVAKSFPNLEKAILFGSFAKDKANKDSDIDIALVFDGLKDENRFDTQVQLIMMASEFDLRIEPHPINNSDFYSNDPFPLEINKTGIELDFTSFNKLV